MCSLHQKAKSPSFDVNDNNNVNELTKSFGDEELTVPSITKSSAKLSKTKNNNNKNISKTRYKEKLDEDAVKSTDKIKNNENSKNDNTQKEKL